MDSPEQQLLQFRAKIDAVDAQLARLLVERIGVIREVAALKAAYWPNACHIRPGREGEMHRAIAARFADTGFSPLMALAIWRQLIGGSTHVESPLHVTYLAAYPEHRFLAREYFGVQVGATSAATLAEAVAHIKTGQSNILILPTPTQHDWWRDHALLAEHGLHIFAALPLVENNCPSDCTPAVALAAVTPENSGDDISYFLRTDGTLAILNGFHTTHENAVFLGAHPRPITLAQEPS